MNETVSYLKAKKIVEEVNQFALNSKDLFKDKTQEFSQRVSKIWEDNQAVEFFRQFQTRMEGVLQLLDKNTEAIVKIVEAIHNRYAIIGHMSHATFDVVHFAPTVDVSAVKSTFPDENGAFGFKGNIEEIATILDQVSTTIMTELDSLSSNLRNNQAFGNQEVQKNIVEYTRILNGSVSEVFSDTKKFITSVIADASTLYKRTGNEAVATVSQAIPQGETEPQQ